MNFDSLVVGFCSKLFASCISLLATLLLLVTSYSETGPLIVKEAIACNIPVVSTDVGDVKEYFGDFNSCHITSYDPNDIASTISEVLQNNSNVHTSTRYILESKLDGASIAKKIHKFYEIK